LPAAKAVAAAPSPEPVRQANVLRPGWNVLAVLVDPDAGDSGPVLKARLDQIIKPTVALETADDITQKPVTERAVVCDLCSSKPGQVPACVNACPHDAAIRIDARSEFPVQ
jgi:hypothetical protein